MKTRTTLAILAGFATAAGLFAQEGVVITRGMKTADEAMTLMAQAPVGGMVTLSSEPGNVKFMAQEFSFSGKPITNAPYSAEEKTESVQTLADGNRIVNTTTSRIYRDSLGRTRREMTLPVPGGEAPHTLITITDPVAGANYTLDPQMKVAHTMPGFPTMDKIKADIRTTEAQAKLRAEGEAKMRNSTAIMRKVPSPNVKHEDLGADVIEGVSVTGTRETSTIDAGAIGNEKPITITSERWYSPDLQLEVKSVRSDPRMGTTTHTLTNLTRSEPDASLFKVPSDYEKTDEPRPGVMQRFEYHTAN
jgi:hypothetical protein